MSPLMACGVAWHQWVLGLDDDSEKFALRAAERDFIEWGGVFAFKGGGDAYQTWFNRLVGKINRCHMTIETGDDVWWWTAFRDRNWALTAVELGIVRLDDRGLPEAAPAGMSYGDLCVEWSRRVHAIKTPGRLRRIEEAMTRLPR